MGHPMCAQGRPGRFAVAGQDALQPCFFKHRTKRIGVLQFLHANGPGDAQAVGHGHPQLGFKQPGRVQAAHRRHHLAVSAKQGDGLGALCHRAHPHRAAPGGMRAQQCERVAAVSVDQRLQQGIGLRWAVLLVRFL